MPRRNLSETAKGRIREVVNTEKKEAEERKRALQSRLQETEAEIAAVDADLETISAAEAAVSGNGHKSSTTARRGRRRRQTDPRKAAGPANVDAVEEHLKAVGKTTQAAIVRNLHKNSGTVSLALKALKKEGKVAKTGETVEGSAEWRYEGVREPVAA